MNVEELKENLDYHSQQRLILAREQIRHVLRIEKSLLEALYNPGLNFWEWVVKEYWGRESYSKEKFIAFYFTLEEIRKKGIKEPIIIHRKSNNLIELRNGHHRVAIAEHLGIEKVEVKYDPRT